MSSGVPTIGFLVGTTYDAWRDYIQAFEKQLGTYGWKKGTDFNIEYQVASGRADLSDAIAADFANPKRSTPINVIVTGGTGPTAACIKATKTIPIVFATAANGARLVASASGNVTGISNDQTPHVADQLKDMQANLPTLGRGFCVGPIGNTNADNVKDEMKEVKTQASNLGLKFYQSTRALQTVDDIHPVVQDLKANGVRALFVSTDPLITSNADIVNEWAVIENLPTMHAFRKNFGQRGTLFWGPKLEDMFSRAADFVYTILHDNRLPPVETPKPGSFEHHP